MSRPPITSICKDCGSKAASNRAMYCRKCRDARKAGRIRQRREPYVPAKSRQCPRCGETEALVTEKQYTSGNKYVRCFSEECKASGVRKGHGRGFVILPDGSNPSSKRKLKKDYKSV